jgi:hypothetical protein
MLNAETIFVLTVDDKRKPIIKQRISTSATVKKVETEICAGTSVPKTESAAPPKSGQGWILRWTVRAKPECISPQLNEQCVQSRSRDVLDACLIE